MQVGLLQNTLNRYMSRPVADLALNAGGRIMASASLYGGLGAEPPVGSRGKAPGGGSGGLRPPEADSISVKY
jgi:hypothetical protein